MPIISVRIPQIGEGLQEARLVAVLKKEGDTVKRDEPIYQMETDKAVMDVESPYEGKLVKWLAPVDSILPIGGEVAQMDVHEGVQEVPAAHGSPAVSQADTTVPAVAVPGGAAGARNSNIPPRTRAYAKEKGLSDEQLAQVPASSGKLMPSDIDAYLSGPTKALKSTSSFDEHEVPAKQRLLSSRLVRGNQLAVPGTISVQLNWEPIHHVREAMKAKGGDFQPSAFTIFAFAVAKTLARHPSLRTILVGDSVFRTYTHVSLGIAVALPGDELVTAAIEEADTLSWEEFAHRARQRIEEARAGKDQASESVTFSLTNMQNFGLRDAVPVVVPPAVGTLFLGEVYSGISQTNAGLTLQKSVNLALTFDHRILNGVGAATFMKELKETCESINTLVSA